MHLVIPKDVVDSKAFKTFAWFDASGDGTIDIDELQRSFARRSAVAPARPVPSPPVLLRPTPTPRSALKHLGYKMSFTEVNTMLNQVRSHPTPAPRTLCSFRESRTAAPRRAAG